MGSDLAPQPIPHPLELDESLCFSEREHWFACRAAPALEQGWKLYVSMTALNAAQVLRAAFEVLREHQFHFKYARDLKVLRKINTGIHGYSQIGKNLVIYANEPSPSLIEGLVARLSRFRGQCPVVPFARALGDDLPLYYRYGAYHGSEIELDGQARLDDRRSRRGAVPEQVEDPLAPHLRPEPPRAELRAFLARFPTIEALVQRGKGGVFKALDVSSPSYREVILLLGYPAGEVQDDGTDGTALVRRAQRFFAALEQLGLESLAPRRVDTHDHGRWAALVTERLLGDTLMTLRLDRRLGVDHLQASWDIIGRMHDAGLYWGDAKLANLIATSEGVRAIDFETGGRVGVDPPLRMRTFDLEDPLLDDLQQIDRAQFLVSVLLPLDPVQGPMSSRVVRLRELATRDTSDSCERWAQTHLHALLNDASDRASVQRSLPCPTKSAPSI